MAPGEGTGERVDHPDDNQAPGGAAWARPESSSEPIPSGARPALPAARVDPPLHDDESVVVPVPLTALTLTQRLDGAWNVVTCAPGTVIGIAAVIFVPTQLIVAIAMFGHPTAPHQASITFSAMAVIWANSSDQAPLPVLLLAAVVIDFAYALLGGALATLVAGWYQGRRPGVGDALRGLYARLTPIVGSWALLLPLRAFALAVLGGFPLLSGVLAAYTLVLVPVIVVERTTAVAGIKRSFALSRKRVGSLFVTLLLAVVLEGLVYASAAVFVAFASGMLPFDVPELLASAAVSAVSLLTAPIMVGLAIVSYLELRVRREGLDLDLESAEVFGAR